MLQYLSYQFVASQVKRAWSAQTSHGFWALADQGVISLGTFLTSVVLARALPLAEYGVFAIICGVFNFLNSLHSALVIVPMVTQNAGIGTEGARRLATGSMVLTALLTLPLMIITVGATLLIGRPELAHWAVLAMILWQFQETIRRVFMAHLRHREAVYGDIISYLGQAALAWAYASRWQLSAHSALIVMAATSGVAGLTQIIQHGGQWIEATEVRRLAATYWKLGRWVLLSNFVGVLMTQAYPWMLAFFHGMADSARLRAITNILGISHPIFFGIGGLICPAVAQANGKVGVQNAIKVGLSYGLQGGLLLLPFYLILALQPQRALQLFYGIESPYLDLVGDLRLLIVSYSISYLSNVMVVILNSLGRTKEAFFSQSLSAGITLLIGLPLTALGKVTGATAAGGLTALTCLLVSGFCLARLIAANSHGPADRVRDCP